MTKKKRELIDILLDNITPDDWPENLLFAAQVDTGEVYAFTDLPRYEKYVIDEDASGFVNILTTSEISRCQHKTIVTRDEFVKRWNERNNAVSNTTTLPTYQESHTEETKPIQQDTKATDTQVGGYHYTKLAIQPMRYSMENKLDPLQHTIIKYVTRFRDKNGIEDLEKAKHCIDMLIEFERNKS
jgi:hypothetical protein